MSGSEPEVPPAYEHVVRGIRQAQLQGLLTDDQVGAMIGRLRAKGVWPATERNEAAG